MKQDIIELGLGMDLVLFQQEGALLWGQGSLLQHKLEFGLEDKME